jgi:RNA polymerase-binding protein DksA
MSEMKTTASQSQVEIDRLELSRSEILEDMEHLRADLRNMAEPSADEADLDAYEREKTLALIQTLERKVDSIDHALRLARNGTYGTCESCGERIDPARLEILPEATLCLNCQRQKERRNKRRRF